MKIKPWLFALACATFLVRPGAAQAPLASPYELLGETIPYSSTFSTVPYFPEVLQFEIKWGVFSVGTANLKVDRIVKFRGEPAYYIVSEAKSNGFCDTFYKVRDLNESWMHAVQMRSLGYSKKLREGGFFRDEWVLYDYDKKTFLSKRVNKKGEESYTEGTIPGSVQDVLSSLYYIRPMKFKPGDEIILDVNTRSNWPFVIKVHQREKITVPAGTFDTILVEPVVRQEGIFVQKGKRLRIWMTDDDRHIPILMKVEIVFGNITAYLTEPLKQ